MTETIIQAARSIMWKYDTRDPFQIAKECGIILLYRDNFTSLKGMYSIIKRSRFIFINSNLDKEMKRIVCAHELGHDMLHRDAAKNSAFSEPSMFRIDTRQEYEANVFAAHLLLDDQKVLAYAKKGYTSENIAAVMKTNVNLICLIVDYLIAQGHHLSPLVRKSNILKG